MPRRRKFTCEVCFERKLKTRKMPDKTSCRCAGKICAECFYKDFYERQYLYLVYNGNASRSELQEVESEIDMVMFYENFYGKTAEEMVHLCHRGRTCPFCNIMQLWKLDEFPRVLESTGHMTFWPPSINWQNWNDPSNPMNPPRHTTQPADQEVAPDDP